MYYSFNPKKKMGFRQVLNIVQFLKQNFLIIILIIIIIIIFIIKTSSLTNIGINFKAPGFSRFLMTRKYKR